MKNDDALFAMGSYYMQVREFEKALALADSAETLAPSNPEGGKLRSNIEFQKLRAEEERLYSILEKGRQKVMNDSCAEALPYYEDYFSQAEPNVLILKEYGDVQFCAGNYDKAKEAYEEVLSNGYMYEAALQSAKVSFAKGDSITALKEFKQLVEDEPEEFDPLLFLGDSYAKVGEPDSARKIYSSLLEKWELDSTETEMVKLRLGWLPITGFEGIIATFPSSVGFAPTAAYYGDNVGFTFYRAGGRIDLGLLSFLSLGVSFNKTFVRGNSAALDSSILANMPANFTGNIDFTALKAHAFLTFSPRVSGGIGMGILNSNQNTRSDEIDAFLRYKKGDTLSVTVQYNKSDADLILYSPYLIDVREDASVYQISGFYKLPSTLQISGLYNYVDVTDGNAGNNIRFRLGKGFYPLFNAGYEYYYANFRYDAIIYYSPIGFESHSLWGEYYFAKTDDMSVRTEAKIGYEMSTGVIITEVRAQLNWRIWERFNLNASFGAGKTTQRQSTYTFNSGEISIYWTIY
jgi:predicted negative regulator of RcsB-dependent stress response